MSDTEEWRPIDGAPGYSVSSEGRISGVRREILKPIATRFGYLVVSLPGSRCGARQVLRKVHRLVCTAFHGPQPSARHQVAHLDGTRTNNAARNLIWATATENQSHKRLHGTHLTGDNHPSRKLTSDEVKAIRAAYAAAPRSATRVRRGTIQRLADAYGVSHPLIQKIVSGAVWRDV